jgi:hypothetical protein
MKSKKIIFVVCIILCVSTSACAGTKMSKPECVQRTSDGPWETIGKKIPHEQVIAQKFANGGEKSLIELFGVPFSRSEERTIWIYESRRESLQVWCDPDEQVRKYDQFFTVVSVIRRGDESVCEIEGREFIGTTLLEAQAVMGKPRSPLGFGPHRCGAAAKQ